MRTVLCMGAVALLGILPLGVGCRSEGPDKVANGSSGAGVSGQSAGAADTRIAAWVNADNVYVSDLTEYLDEIRKGTSHPREDDPQMKNRLIIRTLDRMVEEMLLAQAARKEGVDRDPGVQAAVNARLHKEAGQKYMKVLQQKVWDALKVDDAEVNQMAGSLEDRWKFRVFFSESRNVAEEVRYRALEGEDFSALVLDRSTGISARLGGDMGYVPKGKLPQALHAYNDNLLKLKPGGLSPVLDVGIGYVVYKLEDVRRLSEKEIRDVREQTREGIRKARFQKEILSSFDGILKRYDVVYGESYFQGVKEGARKIRFAPLKAGEIARVDDWILNRGDVKAANPLLLEQKNQKMLLPYVQEQVVNQIMFREGVRTGLLSRETVERRRQKTENSILADAMREKIALARVKIDDTDARKYFVGNRKDYVVPKSYEMTLIVVSEKDNAGDLRKRILDGEDKGALAERYSEERQSAKGKGKVVLPLGDTPRNALDRAVMALKPGEVSKPIASQGKYYVICLDNIIPQRAKEFEEVKDQVRSYLVKEERTHVLSRYVEERKRVSNIRVNFEVLSTL